MLLVDYYKQEFTLCQSFMRQNAENVRTMIYEIADDFCDYLIFSLNLIDS